jgi:hypothetical protein
VTRTLAKGSAQLVYRRALTLDLDPIGHWPIYSVTSIFRIRLGRRWKPPCLLGPVTDKACSAPAGYVSTQMKRWSRRIAVVFQSALDLPA